MLMSAACPDDASAARLVALPSACIRHPFLRRLTNRTSVPNIFIGGQGVGGCNDGPGVATLQAQGKLGPMLKAVGAL